MKLSQFKFDLPESLIAHNPVENRDEARLMVLDKKTGAIEHKILRLLTILLHVEEQFASFSMVRMMNSVEISRY